MLTKEFAEQFAQNWIDSWNSHDLARILSHYTDDFEMHSPYIVQLAGIGSGVLHGKQSVGAYWNAALEEIPNLHFEHVSTLVGSENITIYYKGARGMAAEVFYFNKDGKVCKAVAHYS